MVNKVVDYLRKKKDLFNRIAPIFLIVYFCLISAPYCFAFNPTLNGVFSNSTTAMVLRFLHLLVYSVLGIVLMIANRIKVMWWLLIPMIALLLIFVILNLFGPDEVRSFTFYFTGKISAKFVSVGLSSKLTHIARFAGDLLFAFFLFNAYPHILKDKKQITNIVLPAVAIAVIGVVYMTLFERAKISMVLNGGSADAIHGIFHSKNAFGIFLFNGAVVSAYACFIDPRRWTKFLVILLPVFFVVSILINCKVAAACIFVLLVLSYGFAIYKFFKNRIWVSVTLLVVLIGAVAGLLLFLNVPQLHESGFALRLYNVIDRSINNLDIGSFLGRTSEWASVPRMVTGPYRWFGFPSATGYQVVLAYTTYNGETAANLYDLHNAYVTFYAYHGVLGVVGLLGLVGLTCFRIAKTFKKDVRVALLALIILLVSLLFGMAETYTLFVSMSANTFALSFIIVATLALSLKKTGIEEGAQHERG